jgi:hypothetical protein
MSFITRGSHDTITACALPNWTPPDVLQEMLDRYGRILRSELVQLMERTNPDNMRSRSSSSNGLSMGSIDLPNVSVMILPQVKGFSRKFFIHLKLLLTC